MSNYPNQLDNNLTLPSATNSGTSITIISSPPDDSLFSSPPIPGTLVFDDIANVLYIRDIGFNIWKVAGFVPDGDLSGNNITQTVIGLQNRQVSNIAPSDGYVLTWSSGNNAWKPLPITFGSISITGDIISVPNGALAFGLTPSTDGYIRFSSGSFVSSRNSANTKNLQIFSTGTSSSAPFGLQDVLYFGSDVNSTTNKTFDSVFIKANNLISLSTTNPINYCNLTIDGYQVEISPKGNFSIGSVGPFNYFDPSLYGDGYGVMRIGEAFTVPTSNPLYGCVLYTESGVLKVRQPDGTIITIANSVAFTAGGDLSGTASSQNVIALHSATTSINVGSATAPTLGQVLTATSGTAATWQTPSSGFTAGGDLSGTISSQNVNALHSATTSINVSSATAPSINQVLTATSGTAATWQNIPVQTATGSASGDLSGTYPSPTVSKINGHSIATQTLNSSTDGYVLTWDNTDGYYKAKPNSTSSSISGFSSSQTFLTSGNWTAPAGVTSVMLIGWGGGGAGGGGSSMFSAAAQAQGGGGGGGAVMLNIFVTVVPNTIYPITIGAAALGGNNGAGVGGDGADGVDTTFGSLAIFPGAGGGKGGYQIADGTGTTTTGYGGLSNRLQPNNFMSNSISPALVNFQSGGTCKGEYSNVATPTYTYSGGACIYGAPVVGAAGLPGIGADIPGRGGGGGGCGGDGSVNGSAGGAGGGSFTSGSSGNSASANSGNGGGGAGSGSHNNPSGFTAGGNGGDGGTGKLTIYW